MAEMAVPEAVRAEDRTGAQHGEAESGRGGGGAAEPFLRQLGPAIGVARLRVGFQRGILVQHRSGRQGLAVIDRQ